MNNFDKAMSIPLVEDHGFTRPKTGVNKLIQDAVSLSKHGFMVKVSMCDKTKITKIVIRG